MGDDSLHEIESQNPSGFSSSWNSTANSAENLEFPTPPELLDETRVTRKLDKLPKQTSKENAKLNKDIEQQSVLANIRNTMDQEIKMLIRTLRRAAQLTDTHGRVHNYLRISLTERCNLRCTYCMPLDGVELSPQNQLLSADEIQRIREPLIRKEIVSIVEGLNELRSDGLKNIGITTNGVAFTERRANRLKAAGLDTANISLDTLEAMKAEFITRRPMEYHKAVLASIDHSLAAGITTKVNCVLQKNLNDDEIVNLVRLAEHRPISVRFIEFMPFSGNAWKGGSRFVSMRDILRKVTDEFGDTLTYLPKKPSDVSRNYKIDGFKGDFGIIGSMSQPFCSGCNRIRLTADGQLKTCLFSDMSDDFDLKTFIRTHDPTEDEIIEAISDALQLKKASHGGLDFLVKNRTNNRAMVSIGG